MFRRSAPAPLIWVSVVWAAGCSGPSPTPEPAGSEGGACYPNGTCDQPLKCLSSLCVAASDAPLPCATANGGCDSNAVCTAQGSSAVCTCRSGFSGDGRTCSDIDECQTSNGGCDSNATCANAPGVRTCTCNAGYVGDGLTCSLASANECLVAGTCQCSPGFVRSGGTCVDVNECLTGNGGCDTNATCTNTPGSRTCACNSGWSGSGVVCADVNECLTSNGGCDASAGCTNTPGSRTCACNSGWSGSGVVCTDVDECLTDNGGCNTNAACSNTQGSRTCACNPGYVGTGLTCSPGPGGQPKICLDGSTGRGDSVAVDALATLTTATIEFWFRSSDSSSTPTGYRMLAFFHPAAYVAGNYPGVALRLQDAVSQPPVTGRILEITVDARGGPQTQLNQKVFDLDAALPGFDERQWHHYAAVFTGSAQQVFVDGVELTTIRQQGGSQATSFASAFGSGFVSTYGSLYMALGVFARDNNYFVQGAFSDLRISKIARYSAAFTPPFRSTSDANTVLKLPISENAGTTSLDQSGGGFNVTWSGGASWCTL